MVSAAQVPVIGGCTAGPGRTLIWKELPKRAGFRKLEAPGWPADEADGLLEMYPRPQSSHEAQAQHPDRHTKVAMSCFCSTSGTGTGTPGARVSSATAERTSNQPRPPLMSLRPRNSPTRHLPMLSTVSRTTDYPALYRRITQRTNYDRSAGAGYPNVKDIS